MNFHRTVFFSFIFALFLLQSCSTARPEAKELSQGVYVIVGELGNRTKSNFANNATFGFVVTDDGVVLIDSGGTYRGAAQIESIIQSVTDKPVVTVINTGGQDHRWLGNDYFKKKGAEIIASEKAVEDQKARVEDQMLQLKMLTGDQYISETEPVFADITFSDKYEFRKGDVSFEIFHFGQAHTPGDSFVRLPDQNIIFSGDIVYVTRMLGVGTQSNSKSWIEVFDKMAEFEPEFIVPGHGNVTNLAKAKKDTYDYLVFLRTEAEKMLDEGADLTDIGSVDQSEFKYLLNHETLAGKNLHQVFIEMEWE